MIQATIRLKIPPQKLESVLKILRAVVELCGVVRG
jgi:hypothetical protein